MSIYYDVKEHLVVRDRTNEVIDNSEDSRNVAVENLQFRMAVIGSLMLLDDAKIWEFKLTADERKYSFYGNVPSIELKEAIAAMQDAKSIDLVLEYGFWRRGFSDLSEMAEPFSLIEAFHDYSEQEMEGLFYTMWNKTDSAEGEGILSAYGVKNGKYYSGQVDFSEASTLDGTWSADTDACITLEGQPEAWIREKVLSIVETLKEISTVYEDTDESSYWEFVLNDVYLKNPDDIRKLLQAYRELKSLPGVGCSLIGEYVDLTGDDVRRMNIEYSKDGEPLVYIAEV